MGKKIKTTRLYRAAQIRDDDIDVENRTVKISFSSTTPVERMFGNEVLLHGADNVDLSRLNDGGPLLSDHDMSRQIGVNDRVWLEDKKGWSVLRFSKRPAAEDEFQDVIDGIRRNVSVGYRIDEIREAKKTNTMEVTKWTPLEISLVSVAADPTVGVGRVADEENLITIIEDKTMPDEINETPGNGLAPTPNPPIPAAPIRAADPPIDITVIREEERARIRQITEAGAHFKEPKAAEAAIQSGMSLSQFKERLVDLIKERTAEQPGALIGMTSPEIRRFSIVRALRSLAFPNDRKAFEAAGFEREASQASADLNKQEVRGIMMPYDVMQYRAPLAAGTATGAAELVGTDHLASSFIDVLRNKMRTRELGITLLTGLMGNVAIPKQTGAASAGWIDPEGSDAAESALTTGQILLTPRTVGAWTEYTRQLLLQSDPSVELLVRDDLATAIALAMDLAVIYGSGASGEPSGIQTLVTQIVARFAAPVPTYGEIVDMESAVADANGDVGAMGYLVRADMRGSLKQTVKFANTGQTIWEPGNTLNGYRAEVSNQVTSGDVFFGVWSQYIVGLWGGLDLNVNPYALDKSGGMRVTALQSADGNVRHEEAFSWNNDTP